jgi:hypothetical protein
MSNVYRCYGLIPLGGTSKEKYKELLTEVETTFAAVIIIR